MNYYNPYYDEIKDDRIEIVFENTINDIKFIKGVLHSKLMYNCPTCGSINCIRYGHYTRKIKIDVLKHYKTVFILDVNKLKCKDCLRIFYDECNLVSSNSSISYQTKFSILEDLRNDISFTYVAKNNDVSIQSVINLFSSTINLPRNKLSDVMCLDEFKNLKSAKGKYAFLILDPLNSKIIDILPDRRLINLEKYFVSIPKDERNGVKYIITDMYEAYRTIAKYYFPNATHIIDRFHYIRHVTDAFDNVRIRIQSKYNLKSVEYKTLKRHWKHFLKDVKELDNELIYDFKSKSKLEKYKVIENALEFDNELLEAYSILQDFYILSNDSKYEDADFELDLLIKELEESNIDEFNKLSCMFKNWKTEIINSFIRFGDKRLSNGPIEGMNNHIKTIKRVGFGFKDFSLFRNRLMYIVNKPKIK